MADWELSEQGMQLVMRRPPDWHRRRLMKLLATLAILGLVLWYLYRGSPDAVAAIVGICAIVVVAQDWLEARRRYVFDRATNTVSNAKGRVLGHLEPNSPVELRDTKIWQSEWWSKWGRHRDGLALYVAGMKLYESLDTGEMRELGRAISQFLQVPVGSGAPTGQTATTAVTETASLDIRLSMAVVAGLFSSSAFLLGGQWGGAFDFRFFVVAGFAFAFGGMVGGLGPSTWWMGGLTAWSAVAVALYNGFLPWAMAFPLAGLAGGYAGKFMAALSPSPPSDKTRPKRT